MVVHHHQNILIFLSLIGDKSCIIIQSQDLSILMLASSIPIRLRISKSNFLWFKAVLSGAITPISVISFCKNILSYRATSKRNNKT